MKNISPSSLLAVCDFSKYLHRDLLHNFHPFYLQVVDNLRLLVLPWFLLLLLSVNLLLSLQCFWIRVSINSTIELRFAFRLRSYFFSIKVLMQNLISDFGKKSLRVTNEKMHMKLSYFFSVDKCLRNARNVEVCHFEPIFFENFDPGTFKLGPMAGMRDFSDP